MENLRVSVPPSPGLFFLAFPANWDYPIPHLLGSKPDRNSAKSLSDKLSSRFVSDAWKRGIDLSPDAGHPADRL